MKVNFQSVVHMVASTVKDSVLAVAWDERNCDTRIVAVALRIIGVGLYCFAALHGIDCVKDLFFNLAALQQDLIILVSSVAFAQIFINIGQNLSDEVAKTPSRQVFSPSLWSIICMGFR